MVSREVPVDPVLARYHAIRRSVSTTRAEGSDHDRAAMMERELVNANHRLVAAEQAALDAEGRAEALRQSYTDLRLQMETRTSSEPIGVLRGRVDALEEMLADKNLLTDRLEARLATSAETLEATQQSLRECTAQTQALEQARAELDSTADFRAKEISRLEATLATRVKGEQLAQTELAHCQERLRDAEAATSLREMELRNDNRELVRSSRAAARECMALQDKNQLLADQCARLESEIESLRHAAAARDEEAQQARERLEVVTATCAMHEVTSTSHSDRHRESEAQRSTLADELEAMRGRCEEASKTVRVLEHAVRRQEDATREREAEIRSLQARLQEHLSAETRSLERVQEVDAAAAQLRSELELLREQNAESRAIAQGRADALTECVSREQSLNEELQRVRAEQAELVSQRDALAQAHNAASAQATAAEEQRALWERAASAAEQTAGDVAAKLCARDDELGRVIAALRVAEAAAADAKLTDTELASSRDRCSELHAALETVQHQLAFKERDAASAERVVEALERNLQQHRDDLEHTRQSLAAAEGKASLVDLAQRERDRMDADLRRALSDVSSQADELARTQQRAADLAEQLQEKAASVSAERAARAEAEQRLLTALDELAKTQHECGRLSVALETSQRDVERLQSDKTEALASAQAQTAALQDATQRESDAHRIAGQEKEQGAALTEQLRLAELRIKEMQREVEREGRRADDATADVSALRIAAAEATDRRDELAAVELRAERAATEVVQLRERVRAAEDAAEAAARKLDDVTPFVEEAKRTKQRLVDLEQHTQKQERLIDTYEEEDEAKATRLLAVERQLGRLREELAASTASLNAERQSVAKLESAVRAADGGSQRAAQLEGQLSGLKVVLGQKADDLEEARSTIRDLRRRVVEVEREAPTPAQRLALTPGDTGSSPRSLSEWRSARRNVLAL